MIKARSIVMILTLLIIFSTSNLAQNSQLTPKEELGKNLFFDKISDPDCMSCATCHAPEVGFTGPIPGINKHGAVYRGAVPQRFGNRKPPSAAYATLSPNFHYDEEEGLFVGGNFWDGRATGEKLGNPAADQALGPFLNPVEQNNASKQAVLQQVAASKYAWLWEVVWGEPIRHATLEDVAKNYDRIGLAIAAYEASTEVNQFSSKYDYYLAGEVQLTEQEAWGMELFNGKALCSACHPSETGPEGEPPLFTDFTFDNLGVPKNPENPFYDMDEVFLDNGDPINPEGANWIDKGLGGFLETRPEWAGYADENIGKHKVPALRNVDKRPGNGFPKAYMHNGVFKSLKQVVHFYNTRDVEDWPPPEVAENVNTDELGDLGLTDREEEAIVDFMETLSDGYKPKKHSITGKVNDPEPSLSLSGANPFNPSTQINYYLKDAGDIKLYVFNIVGQKVAILVDGWQESGAHQISFFGNNLPSGIYLVSLTNGRENVTQKVALVK
jgi:cytochrome c peroxidase